MFVRKPDPDKATLTNPKGTYSGKYAIDVQGVSEKKVIQLWHLIVR